MLVERLCSQKLEMRPQMASCRAQLDMLTVFVWFLPASCKLMVTRCLVIILEIEGVGIECIDEGPEVFCLKENVIFFFQNTYFIVIFYSRSKLHRSTQSAKQFLSICPKQFRSRLLLIRF